MTWAATAHTIDRPAWMAHAMMWALQRADGRHLLAECTLENLAGSLFDERSRVQA